MVCFHGSIRFAHEPVANRLIRRPGGTGLGLSATVPILSESGNEALAGHNQYGRATRASGETQIDPDAAVCCGHAGGTGYHSAAGVLPLEFFRLESSIAERQTALEARVNLLADNYSDTLTRLVWNVSYDLVPEVLSGLSAVTEVDYALLALEDGTRVFQFGNEETAESSGHITVTRDLLWSQQGQDMFLGTLTIRVSTESIARLRQDQISERLVSLGLLLLTLLIVLYWLIRRLTGPLTEISRSIEALSQGDINVDIPYQSQQDEVGTLARALQIFRENTVELDLLRHSLEEQVALQTRELSVAKDAAEAGNTAKSHFLSTMSHELRTPLTSLTGSLKMLLQGGDAIPDDQRLTLLDLANRNGERLLNLVNDILDLQKIESGKMTYDFSWLDPLELVEGSVESMAGFAARYESSLVLDNRLEDRYRVKADPQRLSQVLLNLMSNAIKFSPPNSRIHVQVEAQKTSVTISVIDQGPGIPEEFRPQVFQRFSQSSTGNSRRTGGTGLGLAIVQEIVKAHQGEINFEFLPPERHPEGGSGTCFWVRLKREPHSGGG